MDLYTWQAQLAKQQQQLAALQQRRQEVTQARAAAQAQVADKQRLANDHAAAVKQEQAQVMHWCSLPTTHPPGRVL